jgi:hypothetical protein
MTRDKDKESQKGTKKEKDIQRQIMRYKETKVETKRDKRGM